MKTRVTAVIAVVVVAIGIVVVGNLSLASGQDPDPKGGGTGCDDNSACVWGSQNYMGQKQGPIPGSACCDWHFSGVPSVIQSAKNRFASRKFILGHDHTQTDCIGTGGSGNRPSLDENPTVDAYRVGSPGSGDECP